MRWKINLGRVFSAIGLAMLATKAPAALPLPDQIKVAMQVEYEAAGLAMHEALDRHAAGDELAAQEAEFAQQSHRSRYLALRHRLIGDVLAIERSPFAPDRLWRSSPSVSRPPDPSSRPRWDLYVSPAATSAQPWDLYGFGPTDRQAEEPTKDSPRVLRAISPEPATHHGTSGAIGPAAFHLLTGTPQLHSQGSSP